MLKDVGDCIAGEGWVGCALVGGFGGGRGGFC